MENFQHGHVNIAQLVHKAIYDATYQAAKTILNELHETHNINDLMDKLSYLPKDIQNHRFKVNNIRTQQRTLFKNLKDHEAQLKSMENDMMLIISGEKNPDTGKPKYSNEAARRAELDNRKKTDPDYIALEDHIRDVRDQLDDLENQVAMAEAELERIQHMFTAVIKETSLVSQEMALMAAAIQAQGYMQIHALPQAQAPCTSTQGVQVDKPADGWDE